MQIDNREASETPPTPSSPGRDAPSPEGIASLSSGSASDNALGKYREKLPHLNKLNGSENTRRYFVQLLIHSINSNTFSMHFVYLFIQRFIN